MEIKKTKEGDDKKERSRMSGFLPFALFVFSALAIGLVMILMRSTA